MDLKQLKAFVAAADQGSLARAAIALELAQSALSRSLNALEAELAGRVFHRTGRGLTLTELGEDLLPKARMILSNVQTLKDDAQKIKEQPRGIVSVGLVPSVTERLTGTLYTAIRDRYPEIQIRIFEGYTGELQEWLVTGKIDILVSNYYGRHVKITPVFISDLHLMTHPSTALAEKETVKFSEVARLPLVLPNRPNAMRIAFDEIARQVGVTLNVKLEASSAAAMKAAVLTGQLQTAMPLHLVRRELATGAISAIPITKPSIPQTVFVDINKTRPLSIAARLTARLLPDLVKTALG